jgi:hypothetical protein
MNPDDTLSEHFTLGEFVRSNKARELKIYNTLPATLLANATGTAQMLERVRAALSAGAGAEVPVTITSGYRCPALNRAVQGQPTIHHLLAAAADFVAPKFGTPLEICRFLESRVETLGIGQLIYERDSRGRAWVHASIRPPSDPADRIISIVRGGVAAGIVEQAA